MTELDRFTLDSRMTRWIKRIALGGLLLVAVLFLVDPVRGALNLLLTILFFLVLGLSGPVLIAVQYVTGAKWLTGLRRIFEALSSTLPYTGCCLILLLFLFPDVYPWSREPLLEPGFKSIWLSWPWFQLRSVFYLVCWIVCSRFLVLNSRKQDQTGDLLLTRKNIQLSSVFLILFGLTFSLASFDWIMSMEPDWVSTIFAIYNFSGLLLSGLSAAALVTIWVSKDQSREGLSMEQHLADLGRLMFAVNCLWMYLFFSQFMLIWYAGIPEETVYFVTRAQGVWSPFFYSNIALNWLIPFFLLLPRRTKRDPYSLAIAAGTILLGRWFDLFVMIFPTHSDYLPQAGILELLVTIAFSGIFILKFLRSFGQVKHVPVHDPLLKSST